MGLKQASKHQAVRRLGLPRGEGVCVPEAKYETIHCYLLGLGSIALWSGFGFVPLVAITLEFSWRGAFGDVA